MTENQPAGRFVAGDARPAAGRARMRQIRDEMAAEITSVATALIEGLGRPASAGEVIEAELIASVLVRSRRQRALARCDAPERRELGRLLRASVFRSVPFRDGPATPVTKQLDVPLGTG